MAFALASMNHTNSKKE
jgi:hypothetical protein